MPHIVVYNLTPQDFGYEKIEAIEKALTNGVLYLSELELTKDDISYSFPQDPTVTSNNIPVVIIVELLFEKPLRTTSVRQQLAHQLAMVFRLTVTQWRELVKVEVAVKSFNPEKDGFCSM